MKFHQKIIIFEIANRTPTAPVLGSLCVKAHAALTTNGAPQPIAINFCIMLPAPNFVLFRYQL